MPGVFFRVAAFCLFFFSSCTLLKKREDTPAPLTVVNVRESIQEAIQSQEFSLGSWPSYQWWEMFKDPQLSLFIERVIEKNPDLQTVVSRVRVAEQRAESSRSSLFPSVEAYVQDAYQHLSKESLYRFPPSKVPAVVNQVFLGLNFDYEIDLFGKNRKRFRAAVGEYKAEQAEMFQSLLMITTVFSQTYFRYQNYLLQKQIAMEKVERRKEYAELIDRRYRSGLEDILAVENARVNWLLEQQNLVNIEKEISVTRHQMKALLGISPDDPLELLLAEAYFDRSLSLPENLPIDLLSHRPDVMAQIWRVEAAANRIGAAKAAFFPNIDLSSFARLETLSFSTLFSVDSFAASLSPAIHLPLFTGGRLKANLQQERASFDAAVHQYNSLVLKAAKEVADAIKIVEAILKRQSLQDQIVMETEKRVEQTKKRFVDGLDNQLTVLERVFRFLEQKQELVTLRSQRCLGIVKLVRSLGGGYESSKETHPIKELSKTLSCEDET